MTPTHAIPLEVCIGTGGAQPVEEAARAAFQGGAAFVELCSAMHTGGLTPTASQIRRARSVFTRPGLMAMIRPRAGDFFYTGLEIERMEDRIRMAAGEGADGVALGILDPKDGLPHRAGLDRLLNLSRHLNLRVSFHRAFDAAPDPEAALARLLDAGLDRVLTSGTPWGSGRGAEKGVKVLGRLLEAAGGRMQMVIGGGVHAGNAVRILSHLPLEQADTAVHAFSGVQENGAVTRTGVERLVEALAF